MIKKLFIKIAKLFKKEKQEEKIERPHFVLEVQDSISGATTNLGK